MLFNTLEQEMHDYERIMNVLFDLGFATKDQINVIIGWDGDPHKFGNRLRGLRKTEKKQRKKYIDTFSLPPTGHHRPHVAYTLTRQGMKYISQYRGIRNENMRVAKVGQWKHYLGITDIVAQIRGSDLNDFGFDFTSEYFASAHVREVFNRYDTSYNPNKKPFERTPVFRPDGLIKLNDFNIYLEYDTGSEDHAKIEKKYRLILDTILIKKGASRDYIKELNLPFIWITKTQQRADNLRDTWRKVLMSNSYISLVRTRKNEIPKMYYVAMGDLIPYLTKLVAPPTKREVRTAPPSLKLK